MSARLPSCLRHGLVALALSGLPWTTPAVAAPGAAPSPLPTITSLDLPRYMGTWHEIAKYPNRFQAQCTGATSATYELLPTGRVRVTNRCRVAGGGLDEAVGEARRVGPEGSPVLQVRFAPAWLSWLDAVWGDYWVVDLDADYRLVAVAEPRREYLWILSRTPVVDEAAMNALLQRLQGLGFDTGRLQRTAQD